MNKKLWGHLLIENKSEIIKSSQILLSSENPDYKDFSLYSGFWGQAFLAQALQSEIKIDLVKSVIPSYFHLGNAYWCLMEFGLSPEIAGISFDKYATSLNNYLSHYQNVDPLTGLSSLGPVVAQLHPVKGENLITLILNRMEELTCKRDGQTYWRPDPNILKDNEVLTNAEKTSAVDLGLAHGQAGVICFLSWLLKDYPLNNHEIKNRIQQLIERGIANYASLERPYGNFLVKKTMKPQGFLAWCYGELGIGFAYLLAGISLQNTHWIATGERLILDIASDFQKKATHENAYFCHGHVGVAHLLMRAYELKPSERLRALSEKWYQVTLEAIPSMEENKLSGIMNSKVGTYLSLISACTGVEPSWDRCFMLSSPYH